MTRSVLPALAIAAALGSAATASEGFTPVTDRDEFLELVEGRTLTRLGVRLEVLPDGRIGGRAFGLPVSGQWRWEEGYFCRVMVAGSETIPEDCQAVLRRDDRLRFVAERGAGIHADLWLR